MKISYKEPKNMYIIILNNAFLNYFINFKFKKENMHSEFLDKIHVCKLNNIYSLVGVSILLDVIGNVHQKSPVNPVSESRGVP